MHKKPFLAVVSGLVLAMATYNALAFTCSTPITAVSPCNTAPIIGETIVGGVNVPAGTACCLIGVTVIGGVTVGADAQLEVCSSTLTGGVQAAGSNDIHLGEVHHGVGCPGNTITGEVSIRGALSAELDSNVIVGSVTLTNNVFVEIESNSITGSLSCSGNGNGGFITTNGFTNTVIGPETGQCAGF